MLISQRRLRVKSDTKQAFMFVEHSELLSK